jgi:hypothetical protein
MEPWWLVSVANVGETEWRELSQEESDLLKTACDSSRGPHTVRARGQGGRKQRPGHEGRSATRGWPVRPASRALRMPFSPRTCPCSLPRTPEPCAALLAAGLQV